MWIPVDVLLFWIEGSVGNWQCTTLRVVHAYAVLLDYKVGEASRTPWRLGWFCWLQVKSDLPFCEVNYTNSIASVIFEPKKRWNDLGPLNPVAVGCTQNPPTEIRPSFWKLNLSSDDSLVAWGLSSSRIASRCRTCSLLWRAWCAWAHCGHCGFTGRLGSHQGVKLTVVVLKISGVKRFKMKDDQKVLDIFVGAPCFFFFSRDFWMISWSWSWCQVLVKDSALHKSCLRGKLLLFDPTSSLHPCRTVRIKRPELQFSFCWFLVFWPFYFVLFRKLIFKPFKFSMNPFRFKISTSFFSSQPVISNA